MEQLFPPGAAAQGHAAVPRIGLAQVDHFERAADGLRPSFAAATSRAAHHPASVVLPPTADGAVRLRDLDSHLGIALQLDGARPVPVVVAKGMAVYPGAHPSGADVMHRVSMHGTEDFLSIPNGTGGDHIDYHVTLEPSVAGLRLSQNVLEFIDAGGTPRMRVAPPYLIDQKGRTHSATLSVSGCAVDTSTAQPWGRAAVPPGAAICQVTVRWDSAKVAYPILLDPSWTTTGSLVVGRAQHTANLITVKANQIPKQMVLIAGGVTTGGTNTTQSAELYDIESRTFSLTGGLGGTPDDPDFQSRAGHTATTRQDGQRVLLVGGNRHTPDNPFDLVQASPRLYIPQGFNGTSGGNDNPLAGVWIFGPSDLARWGHSATLLPDGSDRVLVAGGSGSFNTGASASAFLYDPGTGNWNAVHAMGTARTTPGAIALGDGTILVAGGDTCNPVCNQSAATFLASAETYNVGADTWTATANDITNPFIPGVGMQQPAVATAGNGNVVLANGLLALVINVYDPGARTFSVPAGGPLTSLFSPQTATSLQDGTVLIGVLGGDLVNPTAIYRPATNDFVEGPETDGEHELGTATALPDGEVLMAGGFAPTNEAELFSLCNSGSALCSGVCTSISTNANCGGCGITCAPPAGPTGVCFSAQCVLSSGNGICDQPNVSSCSQPYCALAGLGISPGPDPNFATCSGANVWADTDGDGLSDAAEGVHFIDLDCNGRQDGTDVPLDVDGLPSATTPDFYLHYDYVDAGTHDHNPPASAIALLRNAFKAQGITLHIDPIHHAIPEAVAKVVSLIPSPGNIPVPGCAGPSAQSPHQLRNTYPDVELEKPVYHYLVFGHWSSCDSVGHCGTCAADPECGGGQPPQFGALGSAEIGGNDAVVSLGPFTDSGTAIPDETWAGLALHELGHNLGLFHGGPVCDNFKPNYLSAMNYNFYTTGIPVGGAPGAGTAAGCVNDAGCQSGCAVPADCRNGADCVAGRCNDAHCSTATHLCYRVDLSNFAYNGLNEFAPSPSVGGLDETVGLTGNPNSRDVTEWSLDGFTPLYAATNGTHIDWNQDTAFGAHVNQDLNFDGANTTLSASNDWVKLGGVFANLNFDFQCSSHFADAGTLIAASQEPTFDDLKARHHLYLPQQVTIDIRPGCGSDWIVLGSPLVVPVVLYGSADVDVTQIDQSTLRLAGGPASGVVSGDTNGDGFVDLTISFPMSGLQLGAAATSALLTGAKFSSQAIFGSDQVTIVAYPGPVIVLHDDGTGYASTISHQLDHSFASYMLSDCVDSATDRCGGVLNVNAAGQILRVATDEADGCAGPGTSNGDMTINSNSSFSVRRERDGNGDGRVYTVTFTETDSSGNATQAQCKIQVLHDANGPNAIDSGVHACVGTGC